MTDHTKALADALRRMLESSACTNGCDPEDMTCDTSFARKALAAYDAHPAEAATRENGAPKKSYTMAVATDLMAWFTPHLKHIVSFNTLCEGLEQIFIRHAALSTHQQQVDYIRDEDGDIVTATRLKELLDDRDRFLVSIGRFDDYAKGAPHNLSRAPQPDTVTDVMDFVDSGPMGEGIFKDKHDLVWYAEPLVRAAITAALAARTSVADFTDEATVRGIEDMKHD